MPGPTKLATLCFVAHTAKAVAAEVLAMPMSPPINNVTFLAAARSMAALPAAIAWLSCTCVIAACSEKLQVPAIIVLSITCSMAGKFTTVPKFTTSNWALFCRAKAQIAAPPWEKFFTISAVTTCGKADTPSAATPWSPAKTTT